MAAPIFNGKITLNNAIFVDSNTWDVELSFSDLSGVFSGFDIQVNDSVFLDTSSVDPGTITRYKIQAIDDQDFFGATARIVFDDNNSFPPELDFAIGLDGMISRSASLTDLNTVSAPGSQQLPDIFLATPFNSNVWQNLETFGWSKYDFSHEAFQIDATTNSILGFELPPNVVLEKIIIKHTENFEGGSITDYNIRIGTQSDLDKYSSPFDVFQPVDDDAQLITSLDVLESFSTPTDVYLTATSTGDDLDQTTKGSFYILVKLSKVQHL